MALRRPFCGLDHLAFQPQLGPFERLLSPASTGARAPPPATIARGSSGKLRLSSWFSSIHSFAVLAGHQLKRLDLELNPAAQTDLETVVPVDRVFTVVPDHQRIATTIAR